jgi:hypothetical protein
MTKGKFDTLRAKLAVFETWPGPYLFKFIAPQEKLAELERLFEGEDYRLRPSSKGRYMSLSCELVMESSEAVIEIYEQATAIEGVMAL